MAEKFSVLIKYKYLEYIENAGLSDAEAWTFMRAIIEYDKTGNLPKFKNPVMTGLFAILKCDLDENRDKWEESIKAKSEAGKKGMKKRWGGKQPVTAITPVTDDNSDNTSKHTITPITKITDHGNDLDLGYVNEFDGGGNNKPPPFDFEILKTQASRTGFFIDDDLAAELLSCTDPSWFQEPHSFIPFVATKIRENKKYSEKPLDEQRRIFRKLLLAAQNYREEFPSWRKKQEEAEAREKEKRVLHEAKKNKPSQCPKCGTRLGENLYCQSCGGLFSFEDTAMKYVFYEKQEIDIAAGFQNELKRRRAIG